MVWVTALGAGTYWGSSTTTNAAFLNDWFAAARANHMSVGVITNATDWTAIFGNRTDASRYPLCYVSTDGEQNFADFTAFGGWTRPNMKIYAKDAALCGTIRRLPATGPRHCPAARDHVLTWSHCRRRHQAHARRCHHMRRGHTFARHPRETTPTPATTRLHSPPPSR